jgi:hypothetical protein
MIETAHYVAARPKDRAMQRYPMRCYVPPLNIGRKIFQAFEFDSSFEF